MGAGCQIGIASGMCMSHACVWPNVCVSLCTQTRTHLYMCTRECVNINM